MAQAHQAIQTTESFRDKISTVDKYGKRIWLYPKKPNGKFYNYRKIISYALLILLFGMPFISYNDRPFMLFNIIETKFILFGVYFAPQDFYLFGITMLTAIVFIALFTAVFGRIFCGWICPQTIFMEMVFRRIEYFIEGDHNAQRRLNKSPWNMEKRLKKISKHLLFFSISVIIAHTFLSYIIGVDEVFNIITDPLAEHWKGFVAMIIFSLIFYSVFSILREQVCTTICPYGRLQGVLLDENSLAVAYDFVRGEPRGKINKKSTPKKKCNSGCKNCSSSQKTNCPTENLKAQLDNVKPKPLGDCIDCTLCVQVCPTGIDIRNGTQLECVNCTACMDACDQVMEKINRPKGLIRIDSYNGIVSKRKTIWTGRVAAYSLLLVALVGLQSFLFYARSDVDALLLRTPGMLFQDNDDGYISNLYNYQLTNKSDLETKVSFECKNIKEVIFEYVGDLPTTKEFATVEGAVFIKIPKDKLTGRRTELEIIVLNQGETIDEVETLFLGPHKK